MSFVFVLDTLHHPLTPIHPGAARQLLTLGKAAVWRRYPFTFILKRAAPVAASAPQPLRIKIDPRQQGDGSSGSQRLGASGGLRRDEAWCLH